MRLRVVARDIAQPAIVRVKVRSTIDPEIRDASVEDGRGLLHAPRSHPPGTGSDSEIDRRIAAMRRRRAPRLRTALQVQLVARVQARKPGLLHRVPRQRRRSSVGRHQRRAQPLSAPPSAATPTPPHQPVRPTKPPPTRTAPSHSPTCQRRPSRPPATPHATPSATAWSPNRNPHRDGVTSRGPTHRTEERNAEPGPMLPGSATSRRGVLRVIGYGATV